MRIWNKSSTELTGRRWAYCIQCNTPGCNTTSAIFSKMSETLAQAKAPVTFTRRGWTVGKGPHHDLCPTCTLAYKHQSKTPKEVHMPTNVTPIKPSAEAPTNMSKADRRVIFNKLEEVYIDENIGYSKGWDDQKVAVDLGVPRVWVEIVRDDNFGPNKSEEVTRIFEEGQSLMEELKQVLVQADGAKQVLRTVCETLGKFEPRIQRLERELNSLAKRAK